MKINILTFFFLFNASISYYSLKLKKVKIQNISNDTNNITLGYNETNEIDDEYFEYLKDRVDFPLNYSDLESINHTFIFTKNLNSEFYTVGLYLAQICNISDYYYQQLMIWLLFHQPTVHYVMFPTNIIILYQPHLRN